MVEGRATKSKHPPLESATCYPDVLYPRAPTARTHLGSIWSARSQTRVSEILDVDGPPNTKPASASTGIVSHVYNEPLQQHPRERESSLYHVCVWSSAVWIPPVHNTEPQGENMILFCITVLYLKK